MEEGTKFKDGEKAVVVKRLYGHKFEIGTVVTLTRDVSQDYLAECSNGQRWFVRDDELNRDEN